MMYIFDLDGTIIDSMSIWDDIYERYLKKIGISDHIIDNIMRITKDLYVDDRNEYIGNVLNMSLCDFYKAIAAFAFNEYKKVKLFTGAKEYLEKCKASGKVALVTANYRTTTEFVLMNNDILDLFDIIICKDDNFVKSLNKSNLYLECVNRAGEDISEVEIYEDSEHELNALMDKGFKNLFLKYPDFPFVFHKLIQPIGGLSKMKPAVKVINPYICPYCGSTFTLESTLTNRTKLDEYGMMEDEELYYEAMACADPDEYLVCNNDKCGAKFNAYSSLDGTHSIDQHRANEIAKGGY